MEQHAIKVQPDREGYDPAEKGTTLYLASEVVDRPAEIRSTYVSMT